MRCDRCSLGMVSDVNVNDGGLNTMEEINYTGPDNVIGLMARNLNDKIRSGAPVEEIIKAALYRSIQHTRLPQ